MSIQKDRDTKTPGTASGMGDKTPGSLGTSGKSFGDRPPPSFRPRGGGKRLRVCPFKELEGAIDYKDTKVLQPFLSESGKILPRRNSGASAQRQRELTKAIKRARFLALLPYTNP